MHGRLELPGKSSKKESRRSRISASVTYLLRSAIFSWSSVCRDPSYQRQNMKSTPQVRDCIHMHTFRHTHYLYTVLFTHIIYIYIHYLYTVVLHSDTHNIRSVQTKQQKLSILLTYAASTGPQPTLSSYLSQTLLMKISILDKLSRHAQD